MPCQAFFTDNGLHFQFSDIEQMGDCNEGQSTNHQQKLKGIYPEFQVICGFSQKIPADLLSYDKIHS